MVYDPLLQIHRALHKNFMRPPQLRLRYSALLSIPLPIVFLLVFLSYYGVMSGLVYDKIADPPFMGQERDPQTGQVKMATVMNGRINAQYVVEGLSASFFICLGAAGFIMLDLAATRMTGTIKTVLMATGLASVFIGYQIVMGFLYKKVPGYLIYYQ